MTPDPLRIEPHPESERTYAELRSEFRAQHLADIRSQFTGQHPLGWNMIGDPSTARDRYTAKQWSGEMLKRLDESVTQDFGLSSVPNSTAILLEKLAQESITYEAVTWASDVEGVVDHDGPPAPIPVEMMTEAEQLAYVDRAIEASRNKERIP